jgi:serine/threonine protein kinase
LFVQSSSLNNILEEISLIDVISIAADFRKAQRLKRKDDEVSCFAGTYQYCAPEQKRFLRASQSADVFSLGASGLHFAVAGSKWEDAFWARQKNEDYLELAEKALLDLYPNSFDKMVDFFRKSLAPNPKNRATSEDLVVRLVRFGLATEDRY